MTAYRTGSTRLILYYDRNAKFSAEGGRKLTTYQVRSSACAVWDDHCDRIDGIVILAIAGVVLSAADDGEKHDQYNNRSNKFPHFVFRGPFVLFIVAENMGKHGILPVISL